jgi:hypothetical protein
MSETQVNSEKGSEPVIQIARVLCAKMTSWARAGTFRLAVGRLGLVSATTVHRFFFSFSTRLRDIIGNYRKMIKS